MSQLLDPTNDYVFKRLLSEAPGLLVALITRRYGTGTLATAGTLAP
ncbi:MULTISPECIES: hypothetical protein [unclassified Ectothiorhodospira]|jgi:hypothetical protein|nr:MULTISPECIES: hypothetical protein [unclassified Ectothiorhodospira]MCG5516941.1 hypothetical protein [Ectothiorhodospira sp. 9100]MCG5520223.1 hypothetical protein [Ectothiorhodospira sp. 9905]